MKALPSQVSVRGRLIGMLAVSCTAVAVALLLIQVMRSEGLEERAETSLAAGDAALETLLERVAQGEGARVDEAAMQQLIRPLVDASAGMCTGAGEILWSSTVTPPGHAARYGPPRHHHREEAHLLPLDRDAVMEACAHTTSRESTVHQRMSAPLDLLLISTHATTDARVAFVLVRQAHAGGPAWMWMSLVALLLVLAGVLAWMTRDTLAMLRRGTDALRRTMQHIPHDMRADDAPPRAEELALVAEGLAQMTRELAAAEEAKRALSRKLNHEERLASLGRVVAGVAHEVRNPLAAMKLRLDALHRRGADERTTRDVNVCLEEIERLDQLVRSLLLASQTAPLQAKTFQLSCLAEERIEAHEAELQAKRIHHVLEGDCRVSGAREQILRVLDNLLRNAIEASPEDGSIHVEIICKHDVAELRISDEGEGVPVERIGQLFEPFFTLRATGTGLGLFTSRAIARAHGGDIAYVRDGARTCFVMSLPTHPLAPEAQAVST